MIQNGLIDWINQNLKRGIDTKSIEDELANSGWKIKDIRDTIKYAQEINQNEPETTSLMFSSRKTWVYASLPVIFIAAGIFIFFILTVPHVQYSAGQISNGINVNLSQGKNTTFAVDNQQHTIEVNSVGTDSAIIIIHSNPIILNLTVGETQEVDLNSDGIPDIIVKLVSINNGVPNIYIQKIKTGCTENWQCGNWSGCEPDGKEIRECTDVNSCGTNKNIPQTERICGSIHTQTNGNSAINRNFSLNATGSNKSINFSARVNASLNQSKVNMTNYLNQTANVNPEKSANQTNNSINSKMEDNNISKSVNSSG